MSLRVLIIPDKFKGTLTAAKAAQSLAWGWQSRRPQDEVALLPMSDGGDGFGEIMSGLLGAKPQTVDTIDAAHRPCQATWWWHEDSQVAIVESARVIGLTLLPPGKYHPFDLDTQGLGNVLQAARRHGARRCWIGVGGSATNDAGFGMAKALGWQFFGPDARRIERWTELHTLAEVRPPEIPDLFEKTVVAVDVQNPLLGHQGCSRIYGPQKGLKADEFEFAESNLAKLAERLKWDLHRDHAHEPGSGAAGGLGFGLRAFLQAVFQPGFDLFARHANLIQRLEASDLVLTGEGAIDDSTLMGKGVGEVARLCARHGVPCIGFGGVVADHEKASALFAGTYGLTPDFVSREQAMSQPERHLRELAAKVSANWVPSNGA